MLKAFNTVVHLLRSILNLPRFPYIFLVFLTVFLFFKSEDYYHFIDSDKYERRMIESDGAGYFAYLPQTFIYKTNHFEFITDLKKKYPDAKFDQGLSPVVDGKRTDKYFIGTAICIAPFYYATHQGVVAAGGNADGYSVPYELSVLLAGLAFLALGMWSIIRLLRSFSLSNSTIVFSLMGLTLATNMYYYTVYHPDFAHVFAFGIIAFLLLQFKTYADSNKSKHLVIIASLLGLLTIIRPTDALIVLLFPFFFPSFKAFLARLQFILKDQKIAFLLGLILFIAIISLQFINIYQQTGQWRFNEYVVGAEGFDHLFNPKISEVLFSFRKGFFIYTPFFILLIPGFIELYRWNKYFFTGVLSFFVVFTYVMASWWCWYYGGSLGMRPMIDVYAVLIIPVAFLFQKAKRYFKVILFLFLLAMIDVNRTYSYQLQNAIIHYSDMDKESFMHTFLQTGKRYEWMVFIEEPTFDKAKFRKKESLFYNSTNESWSLGKKNQYFETEFTGSLFKMIYVPDSTIRDSKIALEVSYDIFIKEEDHTSKVILFGYQNGERKDLSLNYLKFQIPRIRHYYPVKAQLVSEEKYGQMDSLEIWVDNNVHDALFKRLQADVFVGKK
ncbi:MAG: hypothetical protein PHQ74_03350 [Crocinitomicaceae bacterium]|nr:hypothetical protein [Crocinitomicaceae bacterium]